MNSHLFSYLHFKKIFTLKKSSIFANLLIEKTVYRQPVYKQLALARKTAKQLSVLNPVSLSNNKNYRLKRKTFPFAINIK